MSAALNFNSTPPEAISLWRTVEIGWEHTVDEDGNVVLTRDEAGQPVPKSYKIPTHMTGQSLIERIAALSDEQRRALEGGGLPGLIELSGMLVGSDVVVQVGQDPTVPTATFLRFLQELVSGLDLNELTGGDLPNS